MFVCLLYLNIYTSKWRWILSCKIKQFPTHQRILNLVKPCHTTIPALHILVGNWLQKKMDVWLQNKTVLRPSPCIQFSKTSPNNNESPSYFAFLMFVVALLVNRPNVWFHMVEKIRPIFFSRTRHGLHAKSIKFSKVWMIWLYTNHGVEWDSLMMCVSGITETVLYREHNLTNWYFALPSDFTMY